MMREKVLQTISKYQMFNKNNNVIVALSGGADSMALFHFLHTNAATLGLTVSAAHFNHGLRGQEANHDADYVRQICQKWNVPLHHKQVNMLQMQPPKGTGTEEWARQLRYAFFKELAQTHHAIIATAHTLSDNAETVLFHAVRGTGPKGLGGIPPVRGVFVRPLLQVNRQEIEAYCQSNGLPFVTDSTNADNQYARNRLRNRVLPQLEQVHPGAQKALGRLAADMREVDAYLETQARQLLQAAKQQQGYLCSAIAQAPAPLQLKALAMLTGPGAGRDMLALLQQVLQGSLQAVQINKGKTARNHNGFFVIGSAPAKTEHYTYKMPLQVGKITLPGGYNLFLEVQTAHSEIKTGKKMQENYFTFGANYAKIAKNSVFRTRMPGDLYAPPGRGVTKTLKKWLNEQKIARETRDTLPLLCCGNQVLWVWGHGFCEGLKAGHSTNEILYIHQMPREM